MQVGRDHLRAVARSLASDYWRNPCFVLREADLQVRAVSTLERSLRQAKEPTEVALTQLTGGLKAFGSAKSMRVPRVCTEMKPTRIDASANTDRSDIVLLRNCPVRLYRDGYGVRSVLQRVDATAVEAVLELKLIGVSSNRVAEDYLVKDVRKLHSLGSLCGDQGAVPALGLLVIDTSLPHPRLELREDDKTVLRRAGGWG